MIATILQALNQQKYSTYLSLMRSTVPLICLLLLLPILVGNDGIWYAITLVEGITLGTSCIIWKKVMTEDNEIAQELESSPL